MLKLSNQGLETSKYDECANGGSEQHKRIKNRCTI